MDASPGVRYEIPRLDIFFALATSLRRNTSFPRILKNVLLRY
jgi:hypothetical protein